MIVGKAQSSGNPGILGEKSPKKTLGRRRPPSWHGANSVVRRKEKGIYTLGRSSDKYAAPRFSTFALNSTAPMKIQPSVVNRKGINLAPTMIAGNHACIGASPQGGKAVRASKIVLFASTSSCIPSLQSIIAAIGAIP